MQDFSPEDEGRPEGLRYLYPLFVKGDTGGFYIAEQIPPAPFSKGGRY